MKKRRVLALLLALSMVTSMNGVTVLAAEPDISDISVVAEDDNGEISESAILAGEEGASGAEEDVVPEDVEGTDAEEGEANGQDEEEMPGGEDASDGSEDNAGMEDQDNGDSTETPDADAEDDTLNGEEDAAGSEDDIPSEDTEGAEEIEGEPGEETPAGAVAVTEVRMMTFTDDTGMRITYDANAAEQYIYTVEDGVLTKVERLTGEGDGKEPVIFTGNVELTQPAEEEPQYTSIAAELFAGNTDITYVKLPAGITDITAGLFKGCTALKGVYLPSTVISIGESAFETCTALSQIAVPKAVESIGDSAFKGDTRLYMVYMKDVDYSSLTSIGDYAFDGCSALAEFCSDTEFRLPASVTNIGAYAFNNCKSIAKVDLDAVNLKTMGEYAFAGCKGMTDAVMSKNLPTISKHAFDGCIALASLTFTSKPGQWVKIDEYAFYGCYSLKQLILPGTISEVANYAFAGCTNLNRVEVKNDNLTIGETRAFPAGETKNILLFVGSDPSTIYNYYRTIVVGNNKVAFAKTNVRDFYKYTVEDIDGNECADGKVPGGQIWIGKPGSAKYEDNINTLNDGKGVQNDDEVKYCVYIQPDTANGYSLVSGSVRANGEILQPEKGSYYVTMPLGGIVITAEFSQNSTEKVDGQRNDITIEFSNGELIMSGDEAVGVEIKVGQTTRMFVIDKSGVPVSSSKIKEIKSDRESVAKVSGTGVITATGKGTATITVTLTGGDSKDIVIQRNIKVVEAYVDTITLIATEYDTLIKVSGDAGGIQTASLDKNIVRSEGLSITLKANAYTSDKEGIAKDLTWKTSDAKIAKIKAASTTGADAVNVVEIQPGCEGEATITVTAKNDGNESKLTVTQKFVVSVQDRTAKLAYASITVNPNLEEGGELEILPAYGAAIEPDNNNTTLWKQYNDSHIPSLDFSLKYKPTGSNKSYRYSVIPTEGLKEGTYKVFVCLNGTTPETGTALPLTITVKKSVPAPTVKFNTKKTKFNLFYKNGGTDKDGNPITVTTEITKLGTVKIKRVELQALSTKDDDKLFLDNFEIVNNPEELAKNIVTIKRKEGNLKYTSGKKAAVTGYLVIYYEGYSDKAAKEIKVTMPTVTTAPSYVLNRTSVTYRNTASGRHETLTLLDKKTKQPIELDQNLYSITVDTDLSAVNNCIIDANGDIAFDVAYPQRGKVKFILQSPGYWDTDKDEKARTLTYTFTVKTTNSEPTIKTDPTTVTLNSLYPENKALFNLVSNQGDTELAYKQDFISSKNTAEYDKMSVDYSGGQGTVKILDSTIKAGTYTWYCMNPVESGNELQKKVTLKVKVVNTPPTVKLGKGSLALNLAARTNTENQGTVYTETAEIPLIIIGQPEGYELNTNINTGENCTTIECTTKNESGKEDKFNWSLEGAKTVDGKAVDGKISVSLKEGVTAKTYSFKMTQRYVNSSNGSVVSAKPLTFNVKVYSNSDITLSLSAKGKLNLVDREGEYTTKNSIIYTPTLKNIKGTITEAKIYDVDSTNQESKYFDIYLSPIDGKLYVTPKKVKVTVPDDADDGKPDDNNPGNNPGTDGSVSDNDVGSGGSVSDNDVGSGGSVSDNDVGSGGSVSDNDVGSGGSVSDNDVGSGGSVSDNDVGTGGNTSGNDPGTGGDVSGNDPGTGGDVSGNDPGTGGDVSGNDPGTGGDVSENDPGSGGTVSGSGSKSEYQYAELENNYTYSVKIWVKVEGYSGRDGSGGVMSKPVKIKTAQILPKVTANKSTLDVFLSNKDYDATFIVTPQAGSAGAIEDIQFDEKDEISRDTFQILYETQDDGSLKVIIHLKEAVAYACDSTNKVKMYVRYKGQGTNTAGTAITMNIRINK